jgi:alpha-1,3-mannosyltransferase
MRVLHVVRQFHPSVGGLEDFVRALARQQRKEGIDAEVLTLDRLTRQPDVTLPPRDLVDGVPVRRIGYFGSAKYPVALGALRGLSEFDLIHVHAVDFFCDYLALTRPLHGKPLVLSTHGGFFHTSWARTLKKMFFSTVTRLSLTQYRRVVTNSINDHDLFSRITNGRLVMIENGVDTNKFAGYGAPSYRPTLLYIGRFAVNKGLDELVAAFDVIADEIPDARLNIVGNDFDGLYPNLRQRIASLRHGRDVHVHMGLSNEAIRDVMKECSFFVSASAYEGFGQTVVEAMSAGLLPIVNRIKSFETIVTTTSVGCLTDFAHPAEAAQQAAAFMLAAQPLYLQLRAEAMAASARYSWDGTAQRFIDVYERVLGSDDTAGLCSISNLDADLQERTAEKLLSAPHRR